LESRKDRLKHWEHGTRLHRIQSRADLVIARNGVHPKERLGIAALFGVLHHPLVGQAGGALCKEEGKRSQRSILDRVLGFLPLPVIREGFSHVVQCIHKAIKR